ncbi:hypothetical protein HK097_004953, partial [Rhizophlyctis rosea]
MTDTELSRLPNKQLQAYLRAYELPSTGVIEKSDLVKLVHTAVITEDKEEAFRRKVPSAKTDAQQEEREREQSRASSSTYSSSSAGPSYARPNPSPQ